MKLSFLTLSAVFAMLFSAAKAESLKVGDAAPAVGGVTDEGTSLNLGDVYKKNTYTVVFFYPKALTSGCTKQGCSLRDASTELSRKGVAIVGVSVDPVEKQKEFKEVNHFPYPLIADTGKVVVKAFGQDVSKATASRECYVIRDGRIVYKDSGVTDQQGQNVLAFINSQKS
ncbi:MAG TPA: peroxiredoxin [Opitutaceae bacterium]|nr:peroxiredoxin [Opitutaceae bacterium]